MSARLGEPLAVFSDVVVCDRQHEATLITDGITAYAWVDARDAEFEAIVRSGTEFSGYCPVETRGEPCGALTTWDVSESYWTGSRESVRILVECGRPVEQGDE